MTRLVLMFFIGLGIASASHRSDQIRVTTTEPGLRNTSTVEHPPSHSLESDEDERTSNRTGHYTGLKAQNSGREPKSDPHFTDGRQLGVTPSGSTDEENAYSYYYPAALTEGGSGKYERQEYRNEDNPLAPTYTYARDPPSRRPEYRPSKSVSQKGDERTSQKNSSPSAVDEAAPSTEGNDSLRFHHRYGDPISGPSARDEGNYDGAFRASQSEPQDDYYDCEPCEPQLTPSNDYVGQSIGGGSDGPTSLNGGYNQGGYGYASQPGPQPNYGYPNPPAPSPMYGYPDSPAPKPSYGYPDSPKPVYGYPNSPTPASGYSNSPAPSPSPPSGYAPAGGYPNPSPPASGYSNPPASPSGYANPPASPSGYSNPPAPPSGYSNPPPLPPAPVQQYGYPNPTTPAPSYGYPAAAGGYSDSPPQDGYGQPPAPAGYGYGQGLGSLPSITGSGDGGAGGPFGGGPGGPGGPGPIGPGGPGGLEPPPIKGSIDYILIPLILIGISAPIFVVVYVILGSFEAKLAPVLAKRSLSSAAKSIASAWPYAEDLISSVSRALDGDHCWEQTACTVGNFCSRKDLISPSWFSMRLDNFLPAGYRRQYRAFVTGISHREQDCSSFKCS